MASRFTLDTGQLRINLANLPFKVDAEVNEVIENKVSGGREFMKIRAPWTDRTRAARIGLRIDVIRSATSRIIVFAHSVSYGIWLEIKDRGKYQIIQPTIRKTGRDIMEGLNGLMARLR